jgi:uncharacterized phage protein gp47/JayE
MPVSESGDFVRDDQEEILNLILEGINAQYDDDADTTDTSTLRLLLQAFGYLPLAEAQETMEDVYLQAFLRTARGNALDKLLEPFGFKRKQATKATGTVNITLNTDKNNDDFLPMFESGTIVFIDTSGREYELTEDVILGDTLTTNAEATVRALFNGNEGNIETDDINKVRFNDDMARDRWNTYVKSFTNNEAFAGGSDVESDRAFRRRFKDSLATVGGASLDGIVANVENEVNGVKSVSGKENTTMVATSENTLFDGVDNGETSESIDANGTTTRIAQRVTLDANLYRFIQNFTAVINHGGTSPDVRFRLETDDSGTPSGALVSSGMSLDIPATDINDGARTDGSFDTGDFVDIGNTETDVWLVLEATNGDFTVQGSTADGTSGDVKVYDGSWSNSSLSQLAVDLFAGVPPKGARIFVDGGADDDIAEAIHQVRPAGITMDGNESGETPDAAGETLTIPFERPSTVNVEVNIALEKDTLFTADEDTIRDIVVEYIGGESVDGSERFEGLDVEEEAVRFEIAGRLTDNDNVVGVHDITTLELARKGKVLSAQNLQPNTGEKFEIDNTSTDISVTLNDK